jgi:TonB-linked SusC/RagA family outer membrane protein
MRLLPCLLMGIILLTAAPGEASAFDWYLPQGRVITGRVISGDDQQGFPGVNILVKGTTRGTVTDSDGNFSIDIPSSDAVLVFSAIGYASQERIVGTETSINITLEADIQSLAEVIVVGYGTVKKSDVTGAITRVNQEQLRARPVVNALEAVQGQAAGVDITSNERPGQVGEVRIRGVRSIGATNDPLYVVDGIPLMSRSGIETLNPMDIESIDILKDASATAIYGSRGANGVMIITTKKGKEGRTTLSYSGNVTIENIEDRTEMMNPDEYITWRRWGYYYLDPVNNPRGDQPTQAKDEVYFLGTTDPFAWRNILKGWETGTWDGSKVAATDWTGMVTQTSVTQTHNLSVSGGSDKVKASASFGYLDNQGTMKGQDFTRYSTNLSVSVTPYEWFEMGLTINASYGIQQYGQSTTGGQSSGPNSIYAAANGIFTYAVPYDDNGVRIERPGGDELVRTVVDEWKYTDNERKTIRTLGSMYAQFNILPGLRYRVNFGPDLRNYTNGIFIDSKSVNRGGGPNFASISNEDDFSWTLDNLLYYDKAIGKHNFGVTFLQTASKWDQTNSYLQATNIPVPSQKWNALNPANVSALGGWNSGLTERQLMSYMGRLTYGFDSKYLLTLSGRWDGASQLADGHKWAFFPSAALAWRMDQEQWMSGVNWVNSLKVRLGVGTTGNSAIAPYQTKGGVVSLFYPYGNVATPGYVPSETLISGGNLPMANPELGWERTTQYNLGIDFSLVSDRIFGTVDLYTSHTKDLLLPMSIPPLTGFKTTFANIGETKNKGIDVTLNTVNVQAGGFTWMTTLNAAWQKEEIVTLSNGKQNDVLNNWFIGESIGVIYGFESNGLWQEGDADEMQKYNDKGHKFQAGMARPVDQNNDYVINPNQDRVIIGNTRPRWTVGMNNTFTYKNFDLSIFLYGRLGYMFNTGGEAQGGRYVQRKIDYYTENNKDAEYQKPIYNVAGGDAYSGILGYKQASFIKVRYINLGYTFPKAITSKMHMQSLKVYVQAKNPGMLYSQIDWLDMDLGGSTWNRGLVFGLNADF